jgi:serine/threonine-protein kinase
MIQPDLLRDDSDFPVQFGRYTLNGILGEGGMARVFRAELQGPEGFRKPAAVKIVRSAVAAGNDNLRKALINEARVGGLLHHPNVVETYDYGEVDGHPYIAMEYVRGLGLDDVIDCVPDLEPARALEIAIQICAGLDHAHNLSATGQDTNLVHRDLKPSNIIISRDGLVKVMDFGIAKASALSSTLTQTGTTKGTPAYMSPEQVGGQKLDRRSDLFSLGAIISELALGKRLFRGDSLISVLSAVIQVEERLANSGVLDELDAYLPGLGAIVHRCLRMNPDLRYPDAARVEEALEGLSAGLVTKTPIKLWVRDLMAQVEAETRAAPSRASWSSLDEGQEYDHEPTLQTDAPLSRPQAAAAGAAEEVGATRAQAATGAQSGPTSAQGAQVDAQSEVAATRAQTGYPAARSTEPMLDSRDQVPSTTKPAGTLWTESDSRRGLPAGLVVGAIAGLLIALAVVGATVVADRIWPDEEQGSDLAVADAALDGQQTAEDSNATARDEAQAKAEPPPEPKARSRTAPKTPKVPRARKATPAPRATPAGTQPAARPSRLTLGIDSSLVSSPMDSKLPPAPPARSRRQMRGTIDTSMSAQRTDRPAARAIDTRRRVVAKPIKKVGEAPKAESSSILSELDRFYLRRPKWSWVKDADDGRRQGHFSMKTAGIESLEATVHVSFPDGVSRKLEMQRSGTPGGDEVWKSRVKFPNLVQGNVTWHVEVRGRHTNGTTVNRKYPGKEFRL